MADEMESVTRLVEESPIATGEEKVSAPKVASPAPVTAEAAPPTSSDDVKMSGAANEDETKANGATELTEKKGEVGEKTDEEQAVPGAPEATTTTTTAQDEPETNDTAAAPVETTESTPPVENINSLATPSKSAATPKALTKKKSMPALPKLKGMDGPELKPGMVVLARMKGFAPWPSIIVTEDLIPEAVAKSKPKESNSKRKGRVSLRGLAEEQIPPGARGSASGYWPVMFLDNLEQFYWCLYTDIKPLDKATIDAWAPKGKAKDLQLAYQRAGEGHTLDTLMDIKAEMLIDEPEPVAEEAEPMDVDEDEEADDVEDDEDKPKKTPKKVAPAKKATPATKNKRKAEEDIELPANTPKRVDSGKTKKPANGTKTSSKKKTDEDATPVANAKSSKKKTGTTSESATPAPTKKSKKETSGSPAAEKTAAPVARPLSLSEEKERRSKEVLYCRHRLQKSLLTTNKTPVTDDISQINKYFQTLESYPNLEVSIIKSTKINKVLKAIIKLQSIPHDSEYNFKKRALVLLDGWNQTLANDPEVSGTEPNGKHSKSSKMDKGVDSDDGPSGEKDAELKDADKVEVSGVDSGSEVEKTAEEKEDPVKDDEPEGTEAPPVVEEMAEAPVDEKVEKSAEGKTEQAAEEKTEAPAIEAQASEAVDTMDIDIEKKTEETPAVAAQ